MAQFETLLYEEDEGVSWVTLGPLRGCGGASSRRSA